MLAYSKGETILANFKTEIGYIPNGKSYPFSYNFDQKLLIMINKERKQMWRQNEIFKYKARKLLYKWNVMTNINTARIKARKL